MEHLSAQPHASRDDAVFVVKTLRAAGHVAYFAGGCVRDLLLGIAPKDYDVATDAPPTRVRELFKHTRAVGQSFGVILVHVGRGYIEVATFRSDGDYHDGRRPSQVHFSTPQADAQRRDFTVNGLFLDPITGQVIDYVEGQTDLKNRLIRAIGDPMARFTEDHLRLLRAVRFAARFNFEIETQTRQAIVRDSVHLPRISPERIADELRRMLIPHTRNHAYRFLWEFKLLPVLLRDLQIKIPAAMDESRSVLLNLSHVEHLPFGLALAAMIIDFRWHGGAFKYDALSYLSTPEITTATKIARHLFKISNEEEAELIEACRGANILLTAKDRTIALKKRFLARPHANLSMMLMQSLIACKVTPERIQNVLDELEPLKSTEFAPIPFVNGDDLRALGLAPSPVFKTILDQVYDAQLELTLPDKPAALAMARTIAEQLSTIK